MTKVNVDDLLETFWVWLPASYPNRYSANPNEDRFSRYDMEVAFRAGAEWQLSSRSSTPKEI